MSWLFGTKKPEVDVKTQVREWTKEIREQRRVLERQIRGIEREEAKVQRQIKDSAKKGDMKAAKILAKELVNSRKACDKIRMSVVTLNSVELQIKQQECTDERRLQQCRAVITWVPTAMIRVAGALQSSTSVMSHMSQLIKLPEISATMRRMAQEMERAGLIQEMTSDMLEDVMGGDEVDEEADEEIDKIVQSIVAGRFKDVAAVPTGPVGEAAEPESEKTAEVEDADETAMRSRLAALGAT